MTQLAASRARGRRWGIPAVLADGSAGMVRHFSSRRNMKGRQKVRLLADGGGGARARSGGCCETVSMPSGAEARRRGTARGAAPAPGGRRRQCVQTPTAWRMQTSVASGKPCEAARRAARAGWRTKYSDELGGHTSLLLRACRVNPQHLICLLQPFGGQPPTTEQKFNQMEMGFGKSKVFG